MAQALVLVDIQNDYFPGGTMVLEGIAAAAENARAVLEHFRSEARPIFHIQHLATRPDATFFLPGTDGAAHHRSVAPGRGEIVIQKNFPNAFRATDLEAQLRDGGIDSITIVGAMSHMCIDATTRAGFDLGFQCTVLADACATRDLVFDDQRVEAASVHRAFMAALSAPYATVTNVSNYLAQD